MNESEIAYLEAEYGDAGETDWPPKRRKPPRRPFLAGALSLAVPGLGHVYVGELRRGGFLWGSVLALMIVPAWFGALDRFAGFAVMAAVLLGGRLYVVYEAYSRARAVERFEPRSYNRWWVYAGVVLFSVVIVEPGSRALLPVQTFSVPSGSMAPTIEPGDHLIAQKPVFRDPEIRRGDVVVFESVEDPAVFQISRVIGLPGEVIDVVDKGVHIDGRPLDEAAYARFGTQTLYPDDPALPDNYRARDQFGPAEVPAGHVFLMGDNRDHSYDSRFTGPVPVANIRARPAFIYWSRDRSRIGSAIR